jgi:hypothetical protein
MSERVNRTFNRLMLAAVVLLAVHTIVDAAALLAG